MADNVKKGHLVETALRELPANIAIPPSVTVTARSFDAVEAVVKKPRSPTKALRDLMAGKPLEV
ncbi:MAG: hypothetical protein IPN17_18650 [Deltaproteobacteria bacterium]|nr:hypothetical protein [Deltaproteobacteria bacterium]MBK7069308.1 hypothetical protein [Deltaproteobacteria bacterium]MBK8694239.1 hypothetical protein [Deltaproteobacteria bacterium]MBP6832381.1 hypothetical protein [Deltaproteobacteria bacterium]